MENLIQSYTREEILGNRLTQSCIDHISTKQSGDTSTGCVIKEKVADHYFVALAILRDAAQQNNSSPEC